MNFLVNYLPCPPHTFSEWSCLLTYSTNILSSFCGLLIHVHDPALSITLALQQLVLLNFFFLISILVYVLLKRALLLHSKFSQFLGSALRFAMLKTWHFSLRTSLPSHPSLQLEHRGEESASGSRQTFFKF